MADREQRKQYEQRYRSSARGRAVRAAYTKRTREAYNRRYKGRHYLSRYGITQEDFRQMLEQQNGACAICQTVPTKKLHVDHSHQSGKVRGLLCRACNTGLGLLLDNPTTCRRAAEYLER